ncbi:MAG: replicative DNA helicase [Lachnospiraceae bacterium]|nr:replicative DNA helicase [Lachnospiraceae bacterium]
MDEAVVKRVMPHSKEAEQSVLGSMILDSEAITVVADIITGADFYNKQYGVIFDTIVELNATGKNVDILTLQDKLKEKDVPPEVYGLEYVKTLVDAVPTSANVKYYANIVYEKATLRRLIEAGEDVVNRAYSGKEEIDGLLGYTEKRIFDVVQKKNTGDFVPISQIVMNSLNMIEEAAKKKGSVTGIPSGFADLDYMTAGFHPSDLILIAARPAMGKTAFALNIGLHAALREQKCIAIFSLEMSKEQLVNRLISMESTVDSQNIRTGNLSDKDWTMLIEGAGNVSRSKLIIDDTGSISINELRSKCRKYKMEQDLSMIIIDYLQLMTGSGRSESRQNEISEISRSLKALARELNVPVIALSQLSRKVEERPDHKPMLSDLRESGAIEQDADLVMFIYRDDYYNKDSEKKGVAEIIIGKQRNGQIGSVELVWLADQTKFKNMAR